jgi:hypothetical protein
MTGIQKYDRPEPMGRIERATAAQDLHERLGQATLAAWNTFRFQNRLPEAWLAHRLGKDKANMNALMKNPDRWTLDTIAEILAAIGSDIEFEIVKKGEEDG